jgi:uncharacterized protein YkwD
MIVTDLAIILMIFYAAYVGVRRGFILVGLELVSFLIAGTVAVSLYRFIGQYLSRYLRISLGLGNITAFIFAWIAVEIICALLVRRYLVERIAPSWQGARLNRIGGAVAGAVRTVILLALLLMVFAGLPFSAATKQPVTGSYLASAILTATTGFQSAVSTGLGRDLNSTLTVFTVTNDPESTERIPLGFTTTDGKPDQPDEQAMLGLINHERTSRGLFPLVANNAAQLVGRAYATRMLADGVFSHIDNDHHTPFDRMKQGHVSFGAAGENLALAPTLALAHQGLMNSPGHKANILNPNYRTVGIGIIDAGQYGLMAVQDFTD